MLLFHGTTVENARKILQSGFTYDKQTWNCSNQETYFFSGEFFKKEYDLETEEEIMSRGVQHALEQSMITLAIENAQDYRGAVLVFDADLMNNGNDIEPDYSCENMEHMAVALSNPDMNGLVGYYEMKESQSSLRLFTLASFLDNPYIMEVELSTTEQAVLNAIVNNESILADLSEVSSEVEFEKVEINQNPGHRLVA